MTTWTLTHTAWSPRMLRTCEGTKKCSGNSRVIDPLLKYSLTTFHSFKSPKRPVHHNFSSWCQEQLQDQISSTSHGFGYCDFRREKMPAFFYKLGEMVDVDALLHCPEVPCFVMVEGQQTNGQLYSPRFVLSAWKPRCRSIKLTLLIMVSEFVVLFQPGP